MAGPNERRGWSGSAVKDLAIAENGFSPESTYLAAKKAYVSGYTTRAYEPGAIPAGRWVAELGLAALDEQTVNWRVGVETSTDASRWANAPYAPAAYDTGVANPNPGWYAGDVHTHGEMEPGNATMRQSFDYGFKPLADGGAGLDFLGLVDHNNDVNRGEIGRYQPAYPGKLIIPGTEVTTYHGHYNNIGSNYFADFRGGPVFSYDPADASLNKVQDAVTPNTQIPSIDSTGGWSQVNHPTIFPSSSPSNVSLCRGCPWDWSDAETDYSKVDAIEVQTGPADIGAVRNPFTLPAIAFYEQKLATGAHIAAVGSSDSHQADMTDITTAPIGRATTVVGATELSESAIVAAIKDDHTYVKLYGNDGPDIRVTGRAAGASDAIIGDTLTGPSAAFDVQVLRAGAIAARPGTYEVRLLEDGDAVDSATVTSDDFTHTFASSGAARYSIEVLRLDPSGDRVEVYSSPIWFEQGKNFRVVNQKRNKRAGTATFAVRVAGPGKLSLDAKGVKRAKKTVKKAGRYKLKLKPKGKLARKLDRSGKAKVLPKLRFVPENGDVAKLSKKLHLKQKRKQRR